MSAILLRLVLSTWSQRLWMLFCKLWWIIPICVLCGIFLYWVYLKGYDKADGMWLADTNIKVTALNTKITELEEHSVEEATRLRGENSILEAKLKAIVDATPLMTAKGVDGSTLMCGSVPVGKVYLGKDFADSWNALNDLGAITK